jgi:uncharacterized protein (TIGR03083 family)
MTNNVGPDTWIDVLRRTQDDLAADVVKLDDDGLARTSGSQDWDVAQVLGHLGSQAEIGEATLDAALGRREPLDDKFNPIVWARWDVMSRREKADGFLEQAESLVRRYEELDSSTRNSLRIDLRFIPELVDVATVVSLRLNELTLHSWDVQVVDNPSETLFGPAADLLIDRIGTLIGFIGKADAIGDREVTIAVETTDPQRALGIAISDIVQLTERLDSADAELRIPAEALVRLVSGRLTAEHTPGSLSLKGNGIELDDLRRVFPGY